MARHTHKHVDKSYMTNDYDITIYTNGGDHYTVVIYSYDTGLDEKKSFTGKDAYKRAHTYADNKYKEFVAAGA